MNKQLWIGIGIGFASGGLIAGTTCYCVSKNVERKKADERLKRERRQYYIDGKSAGESEGYTKGFDAGVMEAKANGSKAIEAAYQHGIEDAMEETQKWMDENLIQVDSSDPEAIQKAIEAQKTASKPISDTGVQEKPEAVKTPLEGQEKVYTEEDYGVNEPSKMPGGAIVYSGRQYQVQLKDGTTLSYPIEIFCDRNGFLGTVQARENLQAYEKDPIKLKLVWEALGWGEYYPQYEDGILPAEVINNWNVSIETVDKMLADADEAGDESEEATIARERYLDEVERYHAHPEEAPRIISKREFDEEAHLEHINIDYYAVDNVFLDPTDHDKPVDATIAFGVADGKALFANKSADDDEDPDVVYVKNFGQNFVAEITRYNKSSTGISDGSAYL